MSTAAPPPGALAGGRAGDTAGHAAGHTAGQPTGHPGGRPANPPAARPPGRLVTALVDALVDDAAVFPPGDAPMPDAVAAHRRHRTAPYGRVMGRFCCPASRIEQFAAQLTQRDRLRVCLIVDTGLAGLAGAVAAVAAVDADPRMVLDAVEIPLRPRSDTPGALAAGARRVLAALPDATAYLEMPLAPRWKDALDVVAAYGQGATLRTGGATAEAFRTVAEVASFVTACAERGVRFRCTGGLHRAVRHRDERTGVWQHGFLNLLLAAHAARTGGDVPAVLDERDPTALADLARGIGAATARTTRQLFAGYGSCSVPEPVADLTALGLL